MNSFIYACKSEDRNKQLYIKEFPLLFSNLNEIFRFKDCTFGLNWSKETTARALLWYNIQSPNVYTIETSFFGYTQSDGERIHFLPHDLFTLGKDLLRTVYIYNVKEDIDYEIKRTQIQSFLKENRKEMEVQFDLNKEDSGSDSDPGRDELNIKEKLKAFIPAKIANTLDLTSSTTSIKQRSSSQIDKKYKDVTGNSNANNCNK